MSARPVVGDHLRGWLGAWPAGSGIEVVGCPARTAPGWDGEPQPLVAVLDPTGGVVSVPPAAAGAVAEVVDDRPDGWAAALPQVLGAPDRPVVELVLRWTAAPSPTPDVGRWVDPAAPALPHWLRCFDAPVLVAAGPDGRVLGGVGLKRHDVLGRELAVGVVPGARGRGLARRLVAQAARAVLDDGAVPTYAHRPDNAASARVAEAAGFPDAGLRLVRLADRPAVRSADGGRAGRRPELTPARRTR